MNFASEYQGGTASQIKETYESAKTAVDKMKSDYGNGVSTKIILYNDTPESLTLSDTDHFSGRWEVHPPYVVSNDLDY